MSTTVLKSGQFAEPRHRRPVVEWWWSAMNDGQHDDPSAADINATMTSRTTISSTLSTDISLTLVLASMGFTGFAIAYGFVARFRDRRRRERIPGLISGTVVCLLFLGSLTIPIDIFSISNRNDIEDLDEETVNGIYDAVLILMTSMALFFVPFAFFYVRERDARYDLQVKRDDTNDSYRLSPRCVSAIYTSLFVTFVAITLGAALVMSNAASRRTAPSSSTEWIEELLSAENRPSWDRAVAFVFGSCATVGMFGWVMYVANGLVWIPVELCVLRVDEIDDRKRRRHNNGWIRYDDLTEPYWKSTRTGEICHENPTTDPTFLGSVNGGSADRIEDEIVRIRRERNAILSKGNSGARIHRRERERLRALESRLTMLSNRKKRASKASRRKQNRERCDACLRVLSRHCALIRIIVGVALLGLSLLIVMAVLITSIDKFRHSSFTYGYEISGELTLLNPLDDVMVRSAAYFPLDYVELSVLVVYIFLAMLCGITKLGIRCACFRVYILRPHRTSSQALLAITMTLLVMSFATIVSLGWIVPQYISFGDQQYRDATNAEKGPLQLCKASDVTEAGLKRTGCRMSQLALFLKALQTEMPLFGFVFFLANVLFVAVWTVSLVMSACCQGTSSSLKGRDETFGEFSVNECGDEDEDFGYFDEEDVFDDDDDDVMVELLESYRSSETSRIEQRAKAG